MEVGIIAPIKMAKYSMERDIVYCTPSLLRDTEFTNTILEAKNKKVILDCKAPGWKRLPEDLHLILWAVDKILPDIVVLPSYMFSRKETERVALEAIRHIDVDKDTRIYYCIEGASSNDIESAIKLDAMNLGLAIPSHIHNVLLRDPGPALYIDNHNCVDELVGRQGLLVTSLPVRLGLQGRLLEDFRPSPPSLTFQETEDKYPEVTMHNIREALKIYGS